MNGIISSSQSFTGKHVNHGCLLSTMKEETRYTFKDCHSLCRPFSVEFKVTILVTFQTEMYNVQTKSDPRAFRKWVAMESLPLELVQSK
ncbi:hypothetical protein M8C21_022103 [Ambrosia artemisiifolia]|uniref:Uncharacterized protein n=1 Tax=Ambrosia artemisiifolia TaxID=4212 RepID=A0AAD5DC43_AMBAR|nr:hypothetical protein M8C21_022103 [Ambrosia artemisiifolia]